MCLTAPCSSDVYKRQDLTSYEREALEFLYAYMPLADIADYSGEFHLMNVRASQKAVSYTHLVLLDGIPFDDHETILNYDARLRHYIHRYTGKYTFGGELRCV